MDIREGIEEFLDYLKWIRNASSHTIRAYKTDLESFAGFLNTNQKKNIEDIDKWVIREYLSLLLEEKKKQCTLMRHLSSLRSFLKFAVKKRYRSSNPIDLMERSRREKKLPVFLNYQQIESLLALPDISTYLGLRDRTMLELLYSSGLRISELVALNRRDFDQSNLLLQVYGKGKKQRIIPITKNAAGWLERYLVDSRRQSKTKEHRAEVDHEAIFLNKWGERLSVRSVDRHFHRYFLQSGLVEKITPHTIRHTIATHWLEKGMDIKTIGLLLGHEASSTTTIYTHVSTKLKRQVYDRTHPRAGKREEGKS